MSRRRVENMTVTNQPEIKTKKSFMKRVLTIVLPLILLAVGFFALSFVVDLSKITSRFIPDIEKTKASITITERFYMPLDDVLASLSRRDGSTVFLNLSITLELEHANDEEQVLRVLPNIQDSLQIFLREVDPDELRGAEGIYRLREELLFRINKIIQPFRLRDVLFKNIVLQ